ncbi:MAG: MarR family transcriptional regulator [Deltaproteobacteria bacterium]|nr:MarR family transcriptional regulator [Deltaproteobacteria bacterium]
MPSHAEAPEATRRALDAYIKLMRAANTVNRAIKGGVAEAGLTTTQLGVLEALYHLGPMCQRALGEKLLVSGGNVTTVVDNLERDGMVRRERSEVDRRYVTVHLTDAGRERIGTFFPHHAEQIRQAMAALSPDEQDALQRLCKKLGTSL